VIGLLGISRDITERKKAEEELKKHHNHLGQLIKERTAELMQMNEELKWEISEHKLAGMALKKSEKELHAKSNSLEEINTALKVLLRQREEDRKGFEEKIVSNVKTLVLPYIEKIERCRLDSKERAILNIIKTNLNEIISPFLHTMKQFNLTPKEIQVAAFIKEGKTTKEIAEIMGVALSAINTHRNNLRKKLGLNNKKINLRSYLLSLK